MYFFHIFYIIFLFNNIFYSLVGETFKPQVVEVGKFRNYQVVGKEEKIDKKELLREHVYTMVPNLNNSYHTEERTTLVL